MLKNLKEKLKKGITKKKIATITIFAVAVIIAIIAIVVNQSNEQSSKRKKIIADGELARAMTYDQFADGDDAIEGTDNVKFSAFFLRDVNGDGYAEKIKGTCKQIGKEDTLYMEVNVQTDGILKNAKIEVDGKNFYLATTAPKDNELKDNYVGTNIKKLEFNDMANGTQKLITGVVRSGDYSYTSSKASAIGSNINNLSRNDNKIIFTGTYVGSDGNEVQINKEINLQTDWYGTTSASITTSSSTYYDIQDRQNEEDGTLTLTAGIRAYENNYQLNIKKNYVEGTIPQLNGYDPISVTAETSTDSFNYDETTRKFTLTRDAQVDETGNITKSISRDNTHTLKIVYPLEAYKSLDSTVVTIEVPVMTYYEGYNNTNTEFTNPYKSNEAKGILTYTFRGPQEYQTNMNIRVGEYMYNPTYRYVVSKKKPIRIYNEISSEEKDDNYIVSWYISKGTNESSDGLIMKERKDGETTVADSFVKVDATRDSMESLTTNIGIGFGNADKFLGEDGYIKVYDDETDELLVTFTKDDWSKYTRTSPYKFSMPVKHIRVETSQTQETQYFYVYSQKQLDDEYITTNYIREQFDDLKYIESHLNVYAGTKLLGTLSHMANYEAPYSIAQLTLSQNTLSTQLTEKNEILTIKATANESANQVGWTNGSFLIKLPADIIATDINTVEINNSSISLTSYEYIENDNGKFIKVNTKNTNSTAQTFEVRIDTNITPDPRIATTTENFELWASNEEGVDYYYNSADIYDVNDNLNLDENVHKSTTSVSLIAPNSLLTNQTASGFDKEGTQIVSPQIADVKPQLATVSQDTPEKTVKIGAQIKNNYSSVITDVVMLGKIPFEGNTYVLSGEDLGSEFTTKMTDAGIEVPEELKDKVVVYYSENETPDKDLSNTDNGWKTAENITNWDNVKTYLIDFQDVEIASGAEYTFYYTIQVPNGLDYNKKTFSHHGVYFSLKTPEGKYKTQTEPNKLGIRIAEKYNLELQKYQTGKTNLVPGATYKVTKEATDTDDEEVATAVTNAEGILELQNLYAKRTYAIEEIKVPEDYELNTDVIKIIGTVQADGSLQITKTQGTTREDIEVTKEEDEPYKVIVKVEDEAKVKLKLTKLEKDTTTPVRGIRYKLTGTGLPESGKNVTTNTNGEITVKGLKVGEEYTLEETKADGYYLASQIKFTVTNTDGTYEINVSEGTVKESNITEEENIPTANIQVEDEKIPTYNLEISKIQRITSTAVTEDELRAKAEQALSSTDTVYLSGAKFRLYKGTKELGSYITDENGKITLNDLYQYIDGKDEEATYTLKETLSPDGYSKVKDITFKVDGSTGELKFINTEGKDESYTVEGNTVKLLVEDNPSFKLIKKDSETDELLANIKFAIYNIDNDTTTPAKNSKGETIGTKETINGKEYYTVTTDSKGEITADLPEGMYKAVEVEAPEKYDLSDSTYYFGIGTSREGKEGVKATWAQGIGGNDDEYIASVSETTDGGYIVGGYFNSENIDLGKGVVLTNTQKGTPDGMIIKYNANGEIEWAKVIGGTNYDRIYSVAETTDGGYIAGGYFGSRRIDLGNGISLVNSNDSSEGIVIKYDSEGNVKLAKVIGGTNSEYISSVAGTADGGYIVGGNFASNSIDLGNGISLNNQSSSRSYDDGMLIKYGSNGETEWAKGIGGSGDDCIKSVAETKDGGYIVGGYFRSDSIDLGNEISLANSGYSAGMIIKYGNSGEVEWAKEIGGSGDDCIESVATTSDGGYIAGGYFSSSSIDLGNGIKLSTKGNYDGMIIKYSSGGEIEWAKGIGEASADKLKSVSTTSDGGYIVGGHFYSKSIYLENGVSLVNKKFSSEDGMIIKYSSSGEVEWAKGIGGTDKDEISSVAETKDGGYIVGGYFNSRSIDLENGVSLSSKGNQDGMIIKLEKTELPNPTVIQAKGIGGISNDYITSVANTRDGGYIVGGRFASNSIDLGNGAILTSKGDYDGMIIKYNANGEVEWAKGVGGTYSDEITTVAETTDGGFIVGGSFWSGRIDLENGVELIRRDSSYNDGMIIKYNIKGELEWARVIGGTGGDYINSVAETLDGGYIVGGYFGSSSIDLRNGVVLTNKGAYDGMIIKYSNNGETEWAKEIGGASDDRIESVAETKDGGYIVGGSFTSSSIDLENGVSLVGNGASDGMIIKYSKNGETEWAEGIGGKYNDWIESVLETSDGSYIAVGIFNSGEIDLGNGINIVNKNSFDGMIIKYNSNRETEWAKGIGGDYDDRIESVAETNDGGYIVGGYFASSKIDLENGINLINKETNSRDDGMIIKYSNNGETEWAEGIGGIGSDYIKSVAVTSDANYIIGGYFGSTSIELKNGKTLNSNKAEDGMILKITDQRGVPEVQELEVENKRKEFKITTDVKEIDNIKGGSISGEDENPYEKVKYGDTSAKEIKMIPDENYEIIGLTVNGEDYNFTANEDGSYTMPAFTNMTEDKHIVVTYSLKDNKITINKVDKNTKEKLSGATFKLDQIEERSEPNNSEIIGELTDNGQEYTEIITGDEVTGRLGELTNNGTYYFAQNEDGTYIPTNSKTYQTANGGTAGISNSTANSYIPIDLTDITGQYAVVVNASCSSESADKGYATITETATAPSYSNATGRFMYVSGTLDANDYTSTVLEGGKIYYLHMGYYKDSSVDSGTDQIIINSIKLYNASTNTVTYNFTNNDGKYESTNAGKDNTVSNSYIPIDLTNYTGKYNLTVNAEISSESNDCGYVTVTENTTRASYSNSTGRFVYISGTQSAQDHTTVLQGGKMYYLHLGYYKNASGSSGDDKFTVNSVNITLNDSEIYHTTVETNSDGQAITQIPFGKYSITETKAPDGYWLNETPTIVEFRSTDGAVHEFTIEDEAKAKLTVHHYIKGTTTKLAEDEKSEAHIGDSYTTSPKLDLDKYELETDENGKLVLPDNATGKYAQTPTEVTYYYVEKKIPLTVHHYIEGTTTQVPLKTGGTAGDQVDSGLEGENYTTSAILDENLSGEYELAEVPANANGIYAGDEVIVTYYYKKVSREINLVKYQQDGITPLQGAKFTINGQNYTTNEQGKIQTNLEAGTYEITEIEAPEGYKLPENPTTEITITKETTTEEINITNDKKTGTVTVHHYIEGTTNQVPMSDGSLAEDEIKTGYVGDMYATTAKEGISDSYELVSEPENSSGNYIEGNIEVNYYYRPVATTVLVHHYLEGTTTKLADDETIDGRVGDEYTTSVANVDSKYELVATPANANGNMTKDQIIVIYYYRVKDTSVLVHHYKEGTTEKVSEDVTIDGKIDDDYTTTIAEDLPEYYELVAEPTNKAGTMTEEQIVVTYYYRLKKYPYTVNYLEKGTNKVLHEAKTTENITYGTVINTKDEVIDINGYGYDSADKDSLSIAVSGNVINIYYTKITGLSYTVNYLEKDTDEVLHAPKTADGQTFEDEITSADEVIDIDGYNYDSVDKDKLIIGTGENVINIYYTKRNDLAYTVNYLEKDTNKVLHEQKNQTGMTFKDTVTSADEVIDIDGYDFDSVDKATLIIGTDENVINIYYTKRTDLSYKVNYLEKDTNKILHDQKNQDGMTFESTVTSSDEVIDIDGYDYDSVDKDTLTITTGENVINIYYTKRTDLSYKVNYLEKDTNKILHDQKTQDGMTFESTVTSSNEVIDIDGYNYDSVDKDTLTITTGENVINIYYTKRNDLSYKVNYLEKTTNKVLHDQKVQDGMTFESVVTSADEVIDIDGYNYDSVDKDTLTITTSENIINIYYTKRTDLSYEVNYLEKGTNKVLHNQKIQNGMTFESKVETKDEVIDIEGYKYDSADKDTLIITTGANIINIYYTKITGLNYTVNYLEKGTNEVINPPKIQDGMTFEDVITSANEVIDIDGYNYDSVDKETLTIGTGENVINIYYTKRTDLSYKVNYLEKGTNKVLHDQKVQENMTFESVVNSSDEVIDIDGYDYDSVDKDTLTITTGENIINIYYTKRTDLSYKVNYLEKDTNKVLHDQKVQDGMTFESTVTSSDEVIDIDGYNYDSVDKATLTITTGENVINVYYTKRNDLSYKVNYLEKTTNKVLHDQKVQDGMTFESVVTSANEVIDIDGYNYDSVDKDTLTITTGENVINIYYTKVSGLSYTVNYLEKDTDEVLQAPKTTGDMTFEDEIISSDEIIDIDGYNYDSVDKDKLVIGTGENVINIYYTKRTDLSYKVNYLEKDTNKVLHDQKVQDGMTFESTVTSSDEVIEIDGYNYDSVDKETLTITTSENVINIYYTKRTDLSYKVNYLEKDTNKVLHDQKVQDGMTFESVVNSADEVIDIYGYKYDSVDKETLTITTGENVINIYYTKKDTKVTVHYYEEGTTNKVSEDVEIPGKVFDSYETESASDIPSKYELIAEPENKNGTMTEDEITVIYYYRKKATQVIVHYYEENTTKKLSEDVTINGRVDDKYTTVSADDIPIKYELVAEPVNKSGSMTEETIEVIYYYRVKDAVVHVRYLEKGTEKVLADPDRIDGKVDEEYQTEAKKIEGYKLIEHTGNEKGKFEVEPLTITYYYLYKTKATVQYIDKITGQILEQSTTDGLEGDDFVTESKDFENYVLVEEPPEKTVKMTKEEQILKYYYIHVSGGVIEKHIDVISGQILANAVHNGNEGDAYDIPSRTFDGYDLVEDRLPSNAKGTMKVEPVEVIYYYIYRTKVTSEYIDKNTGEKLTEDETQKGHEGDNYTTDRKTFDDYKLVEVPANADGSMTKEDITVTYYYVHTSGGVIVNHIDIKTGKQLLDETKEEGYEGDPYETHEENIPEYDLVKEKYPENAVGKMTIEPTRVTYYYIKKTEVNIKYVDKETGEEIDEPTNIPGHQGDDYTTEPKDIPGYDLIEEPENKDGTMTADPIDVIYYYKRPAKVIVNYYDIDTKEKLADEIEITGHQNDDYTTDQKDIKYYEIAKVPENKEGKMIVTVTKDENGKEIVDDTTYVNYYYRKLVFNLRVDKTIASVIVNGQETPINGSLGKVEVHRKNISNANVKVVYKIKVTNDSELTGKANVVENIPSGMTMIADNNPGWTINETTASVETDEIKPGESREYQVVLGWQNGDSNIGTKENIASIITENEAGFEEKDKSDNESKADLIVAVGTGEVPYVAIAGSILFIMISITAGVYVISKKRQ